jgi:hypothetical protein
MMLPDSLAGPQVIVSPFAVTTKSVSRSWRERLLSWPWQPWMPAKRIETPTYFRMSVLGQPYLVLHPALADSLLQLLENINTDANTSST